MSIFKRWRSKKHIERIKQMPCCICGQEATAHHRIGSGDGVMGDKQPDSHCIPLCHNHHTGRDGIHTVGVMAWEDQFGSQWKHLAKTLARMVENE